MERGHSGVNQTANMETTSKNGSDPLDGPKDLQNMTIADLVHIVNTHQLIQQDSERHEPPPDDASIEVKVNYALKELELTQKLIGESKLRYQTSISNLKKATTELQNNNQILMQNKFEIQENKIESQRTRIELNSLKQQTIDEMKILNQKIDLLLNNYNDNFNSLHNTVMATLNNNLSLESFHKPRAKKFQDSSIENSSFRSNSDELSSEYRYKLAKPLTNVRQIWEEYEYGLYGQPSVKSLDQKYKNRWRYKGENTTYLRRRKIFIAIENCIKLGIPENDAIDTLEKLRVDESGVKRTMAWLFDNIPDGFPENFFGLERSASVQRNINLEEEPRDEEEEEEEQEEEVEESRVVVPAENSQTVYPQTLNPQPLASNLQASHPQILNPQILSSPSLSSPAFNSPAVSSPALSQVLNSQVPPSNHDIKAETETIHSASTDPGAA